MLFHMTSTMKAKTSEPPRERILNVAKDLFYNQGYRATGINEVIEKSGVAKATFYNHFPSKDDLGIAYLESFINEELVQLEHVISSTKEPVKRLLKPLEFLVKWLHNTRFRGCAFLHMVGEVPDANHPLRRHGKDFYNTVTRRIHETAEELIASNPDKYGHLDAKALTASYMICFAGGIALAEIYNEDWPMFDAINTVKQLIQK